MAVAVALDQWDVQEVVKKIVAELQRSVPKLPAAMVLVILQGYCLTDRLLIGASMWCGLTCTT